VIRLAHCTAPGGRHAKSSLAADGGRERVALRRDVLRPGAGVTGQQCERQRERHDRPVAGAEITFRDIRGLGGHITRIEVSTITRTGEHDSRAVAVELVLPPRGSVKWPIDHTVSGVSSRPPVRLRIAATGRDVQDGALTIPAVEVALMVASSPADPHEPVAIFSGAGDIARCEAMAPAEATARILDRMPGSVPASIWC
jgi:hypothetical protein